MGWLPPDAAGGPPIAPPGTPVTRRSGLVRPHGAGFALALVNGFGQDRQPSRWLPSEAEKKRSQREFLGRRRDPSLRATPSFRDRGAVALRTGPRGDKKYLKIQKNSTFSLQVKTSAPAGTPSLWAPVNLGDRWSGHSGPSHPHDPDGYDGKLDNHPQRLADPPAHHHHFRAPMAAGCMCATRCCPNADQAAIYHAMQIATPGP